MDSSSRPSVLITGFVIFLSLSLFTFTFVLGLSKDRSILSVHYDTLSYDDIMLRFYLLFNKLDSDGSLKRSKMDLMDLILL